MKSFTDRQVPNYPPLSDEERVRNAIRFIVRNVKASTNAEARAIARNSPNIALREAARILDERDQRAQESDG